MPTTNTLTTAYGLGATDVSHNDDTEVWSEDQEDFYELHLKAKKEEIQRFLICVAVSKNLHNRLDIFTAPPVIPEHVLNPACKQCSKFTLCMEEGGPTYVERSQTETFKAHLWRIPNEDGVTTIN